MKVISSDIVMIFTKIIGDMFINTYKIFYELIFSL